MALRRLQIFLAVADTGSFRGAAERLFVSQSAISMQMKALEDEWRVRLFDRSVRPPVLNARGWALVDQARHLVDAYEGLRSIAAAPEGALIGALRLGVVPSVATGLLPGTLLSLRAHHPGLRVLVESGLSPQLSYRVEHGGLDAAVITEAERVPTGLAVQTIAEQELKLIVHRDLAVGGFNDLVARLPFVRFNAAMGVGRIIDTALRSRGLYVDDVMELDSIEAISTMVAMKLGVAVVPMGGVPSIYDEALVAVPFEGAPVSRRVGLVTRRETAASPVTEVLFRRLCEAAQAREID